ncbi:MAG: carboxy terminal-processing peptidase [Flavobacteriales bacterium]|nr:carboxy terminal-processing peptidase [Flavobacteriales bacterium]
MKIRRALFFLLPISILSFGFYLKNQDEGEQVLVKAILENLARHHFNPLKIDDSFSEKAFDHYIKSLDPNRRFLMQEDMDQLSMYRHAIDDQSLNGSYEFFELALNRFNARVDQTEKYYKEILAEPFDFTVDETADFSEDIPYALSEPELRERWRKYLKYNVMTRLSAKLDVQEKALEKGDTAVKIHPMDSLELFARKDILKNHDDWFVRMRKLDRKERLSQYVNAITSLFDPHTNYFPPVDKENFDIRMSGRLEGIGAQLQEKDGYIKVVNVIPGSPCALQGELAVNDLILKVAQGKEEPVDIVNANINDAVQLIRGKKGTEVRLTVQKPDGSISVIPIIRDVVILEETFAKSLIVSDEDQRKIGYLNLPSFYTDFTGNKGRTCWKDVEAELEKLKNDGAEALVFDLRNNGGGSLSDVVHMAGLFIEKGPIVQIKANNSSPEVLKDYDPKVQWDKPVVIMVNEFSASASEILAAALQDYQRAVILGSHTTHGKGTVQRFIPLNETLRDKSVPDLGSLKLTTQKFYRINGGATQLKGVTPHIILPDNYMYIETGEMEQDFALEWDQIKEVEYNTADPKWLRNLDKLKKESNKRITSQPLYTRIEENAKRWKSERDQEVFTLNLKTYRAEEAEQKAYNASYDSLFKPYEQLKFERLSLDRPVIEADSGKVNRWNDWEKRLKKDPYLLEAVQVSEDMIRYTR